MLRAIRAAEEAEAKAAAEAHLSSDRGAKIKALIAAFAGAKVRKRLKERDQVA